MANNLFEFITCSLQEGREDACMLLDRVDSDDYFDKDKVDFQPNA